MTVFWPKIGQFFTKIYKILEINKKHLNTPNKFFLGHLKHFLPEKAILGRFWAIFAPMNLYRNLPAGRHTPLTLSAITCDSETLAQKVIPFWKALEIGYLMVSKVN